jgi:glycosyltransferase involved in cell wall biosynthesis
VNEPPPHPDIAVVGEVGDGAKWGLLERARVLVSPSPYESFALVVLEAWAAGIPVIVNGACEATLEQCQRSGGGLAFTGYASFEAALDRLLADDDLRLACAEAGRSHVARQFAWPSIVERYGAFVSAVIRGRGNPPPA